MATVVDQLIVDVRANTVQAVTAIGAVTTEVGLLTGAAAGLTAVGSFLTKGITLPVAALGGIGVKSFADFDAAMTESLAIMGDVTPKMRKMMDKAARDVAKSTIFSAKEAAEGFYYLISAGMDAEQSIAALPQVAAFAQAGMFDLDRATEMLIDSQFSLGLQSKDAKENLEGLTRVTDVYTKAAVTSNATVEQFAESMSRKAGAALRTLGKDIEEGVAVLSVFADQGLKGEIAGQALYMVLRDLQTAAVKFPDTFKDMGVAVYDSSGEMRNMADIISDLESALAGMSDEQRKATLLEMGFTDRSVAYIQALLGTSDAIREYETSIRDSTGYTQDVAAKQLEAFKNQWILFKHKLTDISITIGSVLLPKLIELVDAVTPYVDKVAEWIDQNATLAITIGGIAAAIGPAIWFVGQLTKLIGFLTTPVGLVVTAIGGLVWVVSQMGITWDDVLAAIDEAYQWFKTNVLDNFVAWIEEHKTQINEKMTAVKDFFIGVWEDIKTTAEPIIESTLGWIMEQVEAFSSWWDEIWGDIKKVIDGTLEFIQKIWEAVWPNFLKFIGPVWDGIMTVIGGALEFIRGVIQTVLGLITGNWSGAWEGIKKIGIGAWEAIKGAFSIAWNSILYIFRVVIDILKGWWDDLWEDFGGVVEGAWRWIVGMVESGVNNLLKLISGFVNGFIDIVNGLIDGANLVPGIDIKKLSHVSMQVRFDNYSGKTSKAGLLTPGIRGFGPAIPPSDPTAGWGGRQPSYSSGGNRDVQQLFGDVYINGNTDPAVVAQELAWKLKLAGNV